MRAFWGAHVPAGRKFGRDFIFYDINARSNFVANPLNVLGWDPHDRLIDYLETLITEKVAA